MDLVKNDFKNLKPTPNLTLKACVLLKIRHILENIPPKAKEMTIYRFLRYVTPISETIFCWLIHLVPGISKRAVTVIFEVRLCRPIIGFHKPLKSCLYINITNASVGPMPTNKFQPHEPHDHKKLKPTYQNLSQLIGSPNIFHFCKILFCCVFYAWSNRSTFLGHPVGQHCWH